VAVNFCLKDEFVEEFSKKLIETFSARLILEETEKKMVPFKEK
jgi:hypothetical protein